MKKIIILTIVALYIATVAQADDNIDNIELTNQLTVTITGIKSQNGRIRIALFDSKKSYDKGGEKFRFKQVAIPAAGESETHVFNGLPQGEYAIKLYHDENDNSWLDRVPIIRIPTEPYGFSNNASSTFGPPSFEAAAFRVDQSETTQVIAIQ